MVQKNDAEAIISMERYNELLKYEELCKKEETYIWVWTGNLIGKSLTLGKIPTAELIANELKDLSDKINVLSEESDNFEFEKHQLERKIEELETEIIEIKSKWWFKFCDSSFFKKDEDDGQYYGG